jgi:inner membrane protein
MSWSGSFAFLKKPTKRERMILTFSGIAPDIDGVGVLIDMLAPLFGMSTNLWVQYHHTLHTLFFAIVVALMAAFFASKQKLFVGFLAFVFFHIHLLCDLLGSRGPDGYLWPIPYFSPISNDFLLIWSGQWELNAWQNVVIACFLFFVTYRLIKIKKVSPFEIISEKMSQTFLKLLKVW